MVDPVCCEELVFANVVIGITHSGESALKNKIASVFAINEVILKQFIDKLKI